jgi:hypothetical protein
MVGVEQGESAGVTGHDGVQQFGIVVTGLGLGIGSGPLHLRRIDSRPVLLKVLGHRISVNWDPGRGGETLEPMSIDEIIDYVEGLGGVLTLRPQEGDGSPEIAWGDAFFYYAPDGVVPQTQPFATIVTKDYPDDRTSHLDRPGAFRVNVAAGTDQFTRWTGQDPRDFVAPEASPAGDLQDDVVIGHPVYGSLGWLCAVNPGERTASTIQELLAQAHRLAQHRYQRRSQVSGSKTND